MWRNRRRDSWLRDRDNDYLMLPYDEKEQMLRNHIDDDVSRAFGNMSLGPSVPYARPPGMWRITRASSRVNRATPYATPVPTPYLSANSTPFHSRRASAAGVDPGGFAWSDADVNPARWRYDTYTPGGSASSTPFTYRSRLGSIKEDWSAAHNGPEYYGIDTPGASGTATPVTGFEWSEADVNPERWRYDIKTPEGGSASSTPFTYRSRLGSIKEGS
jgi:hypothetical protein